MKTKPIISLIAVEIFILFYTSSAMTLDPGSIDRITTHPDRYVRGWPDNFAVFYPNPAAAWIDDRGSGNPSIYGVSLDDPSYTEFLIDSDIIGCDTIAAWGTYCTYNLELSQTEQYIRIADISDPNHPLLWDYQVDWPGQIDICDTIVVYTGNDPDTWEQTVYALDISDPNNIQQYPIHTFAGGEYANDLVVDNHTIVWCVPSSEYGAYVQIADISDVNNPAITTKVLPENMEFQSLDISGDWLVALGQSSWRYRIYAIHNYTDVNNWDILTLWKEGVEGDYFRSAPRINGPIAAWVTSSRMPSLLEQLDDGSMYFIKSAYLMANGEYTLSTLRSSESEISAAEVLNKQIVWSEYTTQMDLIKGSLLIECGDWGYKPGDLNKNCQVDFSDFAILAANWLDCTMPDNPDCDFGYSGLK